MFVVRYFSAIYWVMATLSPNLISAADLQQRTNKSRINLCRCSSIEVAFAEAEVGMHTTQQDWLASTQLLYIEICDIALPLTPSLKCFSGGDPRIWYVG